MYELNLWLAGSGLLIGLIFGAIMQRYHFCLVAAVSNAMLIRDFRHAQSFLAAWAVAIVGTALLESSGVVAVASSSYRAGYIDWFGAGAGGLVFGFGATLAGGCATRTLVRTAEGNIGGLIALIALIFAATVAQYGILAPPRAAILELTAVYLASDDSGVASLLSIPAWVPGVVAAVICLVVLRLLGPVKGHRDLILGAAGIGMLTVAGWYVTGWLAHDEFEYLKPASVKLTGPLARITINLVTGDYFIYSFGLTFVTGVFAGALLTARATGTFHWVMPRPERVPHYILGGLMMGVGAIVAGGCNIGQGLSGVSTLSVTSIIATISIYAGVVFGTKWWEWHD